MPQTNLDPVPPMVYAYEETSYGDPLEEHIEVNRERTKREFARLEGNREERKRNLDMLNAKFDKDAARTKPIALTGKNVKKGYVEGK